MTVKRHFLLKTCAEGVGFLAGAVFALMGGPHFRFMGVPFPFSAAGPILLGILLPFLIFKFIPARCPRCGKSAYAAGMDGVRYLCRTCGYREQMPFTAGGDQILP
ncbi:MAG TPA: hypothetical protein VGP94_15565 [Tepidisphaeraceae bacterium]|jgi:ribosomal protein S27AE|nr:hypothetical protein [Tepidisphaeraceae bacterium]